MSASVMYQATNLGGWVDEYGCQEVAGMVEAAARGLTITVA